MTSTQPSGNYVIHSLQEWNEQNALAALNIQRVEFDDLDGNTQGYSSRGRKITCGPIARFQKKGF
jgi:hypothetical protein